jgi:hypothetical protein
MNYKRKSKSRKKEICIPRYDEQIVPRGYTSYNFLYPKDKRKYLDYKQQMKEVDI